MSHVLDTATYAEAVGIARELMQPLVEANGTEYARGQVALIADLWGHFEKPTDVRMIEVALDIGVEL